MLQQWINGTFKQEAFWSAWITHLANQVSKGIMHCYSVIQTIAEKEHLLMNAWSSTEYLRHCKMLEMPSAGCQATYGLNNVGL